MAIVACKECGADVSDKATKCPSCGVRLRKPKRGFFGTVFKWTFILFNIAMIIWLVSYWAQLGSSMEGQSEAYQAGTAIGATIGTGMVATIWVLGDIILGALVFFTRARD